MTARPRKHRLSREARCEISDAGRRALEEVTARRPPPRLQRTKWHVYLQARAAKREWVGEIEAVDDREAIEIAAKEFRQPVKKLMAVPRR